MSTVNEPMLTGSVITDKQGRQLGRVRDVLFDGLSSTPTWMVVKPGALRAERYVPARGVERVDAETLVVPYSREQVTAAPKAARDHVLDQRDRARLIEHFDLRS